MQASSPAQRDFLQMVFDATEFTSCISNIDKRIPLPDFASKLRELDLPVSNSWSKTVAALTEIAENPKNSPDVISSLEAITSWVSEYFRYSSKAIFIFDFPNSKPGKIQDLADDFRKNLRHVGVRRDHPATFPGLLDKDELTSFNGKTMLRKVYRQTGGVSFVFSSIREYQIRETIAISPADTQAVGKLDGYSKVVGIRTALHEQIDTIRFRWTGKSASSTPTIEMILDITKPGGSILNSNEILIRSKEYRSIINTCLLRSNGSFVIPSELNFFPVIQKIYNSKEGNVCELGFVTMLGNSMKTEKMKRNSADLRSETWHAGAMVAIASAPTPDTIDIYKLNVSWRITMSDDEPILSIPGSYRALSSASIDHAIILGCTGRSSFDFTYGRLMTFARMP
jgi:hypothetical protein